ncbi:DUF2764 family protein [Marinifilum caeruleilacunae]|nr:DUF2764 family protein [Marinifilum caeruleilacunae]
MSSLPSLTFGQKPPISLSDFKEDAKKQLSAKHFKMLERVDVQGNNGQVDKSFLKNVNTLLKEVYQDLSEIREARKQNRQANLIRLSLIAIAGNPLQREKQIMKYLWEELESIESGKTFSMTEVMVYKLKLQILSRMNSFNAKLGAEVLTSIVNPSKKGEVQ